MVKSGYCVGLVATVAGMFVSGCASVPGEVALKAGESPLIVSHRGGRAEVDDNSAEGFEKCLAAGVRGFETDIRMTRDDELVIMHDGSVSRTTTGTGSVKDMTLAEVTSLKLKRSGFSVPSVQRVMDVFRGRDDVRVEFEMKENTKSLGRERGETYCRKLHDKAIRTMEPGAYVFTSFNVDTLKTMKRLFPDAPIAHITGHGLTRKFVDGAVELGCCGVAPGVKGTTKEMVDYAHSRGLAVSVWMVQDLGAYMKAREIGADTITSDRPMQLLKDVSER